MTVTRVLHCVPQLDGASGEGDAVLLNGYIVSHDPRVQQAQGRRGIGPDPKTSGLSVQPGIPRLCSATTAFASSVCCTYVSVVLFHARSPSPRDSASLICDALPFRGFLPALGRPCGLCFECGRACTEHLAFFFQVRNEQLAGICRLARHFWHTSSPCACDVRQGLSSHSRS